MAIELLKRGQAVELTKDNPNLKVLNLALGWDIQRYSGRHDFDLDVSVFLLGKDGKCRDDRDIVFYGQKAHESGAVIHSGDNRNGSGDGDDEVIKVDLTKIPAEIDKIVGVVSIYDWKSRDQNFGMVDNAYVRVDNAETNEQLYQYNLKEQFSTQTSVKVFEVYRYNGEWKFRAVGDGYDTGLGGFVREFGLQVQGQDI